MVDGAVKVIKVVMSAYAAMVAVAYAVAAAAAAMLWLLLIVDGHSGGGMADSAAF